MEQKRKGVEARNYLLLQPIKPSSKHYLEKVKLQNKKKDYSLAWTYTKTYSFDAKNLVS